MDTKVTLRFDKGVVQRAKKFANKNNMSLSRLTELLLRKVTDEGFASLEDIPVAEWVHLIAEGEAEYHTKRRSRTELKNQYFKSRK